MKVAINNKKLDWKCCLYVMRVKRGPPCKLSRWLHLLKFGSASSFLADTMRQDPPGCYDFRPVSIWNASRPGASVIQSHRQLFGQRDRTQIRLASKGSCGPAQQDGGTQTRTLLAGTGCFQNNVLRLDAWSNVTVSPWKLWFGTSQV